jgi:pimeloyl-ACP methyl ester carboxylesterase
MTTNQSESEIEKETTMRSVRIPIGRQFLHGDLHIPPNARGLVLFVHGSGSSRHSPRNRFVARTIREQGNATLLFDLLTQEEEVEDRVTAALRFDIGLLACRLMEATRWALSLPETRNLSIGYFGSSTGGGAALAAAADLKQTVKAVVSRGGRPDLAGPALPLVQAATLLIVGGRDEPVIRLNEGAFARLQCGRELKIIPGATHLFEEDGALEQVAQLAAEWFQRHLRQLPAGNEGEEERRP